MFQWLREKISNLIILYLRKPVWKYEPFSITSPEILEQHLQPGDVLLVEGNLRVSSIIKYLTQSTWSHAALYIGPDLNAADEGPSESLDLIEAEADGGVKCVSLNKYRHFNTRICRPASLSPEEKLRVIAYARNRIGQQYDMKNIIDLGRYMFPYPPVPVFLRRRMLALGSGDPTRAICSTLIAEAFQSVQYPILPEITEECVETGTLKFVREEIYHIRHYSLFTPRDFDLSPYFSVIKPTLESGFDHKTIKWKHLGQNEKP
ncbi:YiiX/YebB-like N1pC/P60 family cysteine hydrolase [Paremcibacter congregatus]|uniref:YiiX/YebB-like N1pC/P60 family cysteine hydrolase n=1 Tax=Paremcibacter congregatus TaxID=2043170 RepID=UPI003A8CAA46|tara:strand:+ start:625 stop:1410 length:786 start_codon:yes stop_codon:yes gene_type:complete